MSWMNTLVKRYVQKWSKELSDMDMYPAAVQSKELKLIASTPIFRYMHPDAIQKDIKTYIDQYEISTYDDYSVKIHKAIGESNCKYYAQSSGTTSGTIKLIPTPDLFVTRNHLRGSWYLLHTLYDHDATMSVFKQKNLLIGGSLYEKGKGYTIGDVSGIMISRIPRFFRPWYVPSISDAIQPDWKKKLEVTATKAAKEDSVALLAGTPTWVLSVLRSVLEKSDQSSLTTLWPNLKAYIHGGVDFAPYKSQMEMITIGSEIRYIEVYNASEGFFAYQDRPKEEGMRLMLSSGIYYEFIRLSDYVEEHNMIIALEEVELEVNYVMLITTMSGLVRYVQGDVVKFVTRNPYRIKVVRRIETYINAFGEDLLLTQVQQALSDTNKKHKVTISNFHIAPYYLSLESKGRHDWFIEWRHPPVDRARYLLDLDLAVQSANPNYKQKREADIALESLQIYDLPKGLISSYFEKFGKLSAQSKLQRMRNDRVIADRLMQMLS